MSKRRILYVSHQIKPYFLDSIIAEASLAFPKKMNESDLEIRVFTPRFGVINERRHQLHEVIRLSGINIIIDDEDQPLIIKVASVPQARMQVYFIDNDEYFRRKSTVTDENDEFHADNDERSMFFCRGVLETVKKLGWQPDVIHCNGWMTALMPMYIKELYKDDPHFADTKVVYNMYNTGFNNNWDARFSEKLKFDGFSEEVASEFADPNYENISKVIVKYVDGLSVGSEELDANLRAIFDAADCPKLDYVAEEHQTKEIASFIDKIIEEEVVI